MLILLPLLGLIKWVESGGSKMASGPPGMIVAPSGAVYKPEECGMDGNGNGWCAGEAVPAEFFMKDEDLNAKQADKDKKKKKKPKKPKAKKQPKRPMKPLAKMQTQPRLVTGVAKKKGEGTAGKTC